MKKLIFVITVLIYASLSFGQSLNQIYNRPFTWSSKTDANFTTILVTSDNKEFVNGFDGPWSGSAIGGFVNGNSIWKQIENDSTSISDLQFAVLENAGKIFYLSSKTNNPSLIIRTKDSGEMLRTKSLSANMSFCGYGDSVIAITSSSSARVIILNNNGDSTRQFPLGYSLNNGYVCVKQKENNLFIFGQYYASTWNSFAEKRNLQTGQVVWRKQFVKAFSCRGDIDTNGNAYIGLVFDSTARNPFGLVKIDQNGNIAWEKYWYPNKTDAANKENYIGGVSVSKKNIIVFAGECEKDSASNTPYQANYFIGRNAETGDSLFAEKTVNSSNTTVDHLKGVAFDSSGYSFVVIGKFRANGFNTCFLKKYHYDTVTGIHGIGETIPTSFRLSQNYPNPFNPNTKIQFSILRKSVVTLKIYDILGKEIATLVNEVKSAGSYSVDFNGSNLPSGNYFYRIETDGNSEVKKMTLVK